MKRKKTLTALNQKRISNLVFLLPALLVFTLFIIIPFIDGIPVAFSDWDGISKERGVYIGFSNFLDMFTDRSVQNATKNTLYYTFYTVLGSNLAGLMLALGIQRKTKLNNVLRTVYFMPYVICLLLAAYMWRYMFSGIFYRYLGISSPLGSAKKALNALIFIAIWRDAGYTMVVYIAGLNMIPTDYFEVATVDGAGPFRRFFSITLPLLMPSIAANVVLTLSYGLKQFDLVMAATGGGPGKSTQTLAIVIYKNIFEFMHAGYGQAMAIVFTVFVMTISSLVSYALRRREVEL